MIAPKAESGNAKQENISPNNSSDGSEQPGLGDSSAESSSPASVRAARPLDQTPELIPVRMLNEFTYCRRLGYLEFVDGEWDDNLETKQGTFGHRRVDKPDRQKVPGSDTSNAEESIADADSARPPEQTSGTQHQQISPSDQRERLGASDSPTSSDSPTPSPAGASRPSRLHARSILLSAPDEGLIAKLDLLELDGGKATPVDYKRGRAPKVAEGAYEPERVQLCAQGLILRENGFQCDEGVLYFIASKKRVVIPFTDDLIARTRQLQADFRQTAAAGVIPPPLVDSPKCPRCSLVGICLPDETVFLQGEAFRQSGLFNRQDTGEEGDDSETNFLTVAFTPSDQRERLGACDSPTSINSPTPSPAGASRPPVRKLLPARDDATPFYVQEFGAMLGKSGDRLQVKKKGDVIGERRLMDVSQVSLFGSVMVSAQALSELMGRGIPVCHFSHGGWFHGITAGLVHKNVQLRIRQYEAASHEGEAVLIARQLISGKIRNCRTLLRRHLDKSDKPLLDKLDRYRRKAEAVCRLDSLLGIEGMAAKEYFSGLFRLLGTRHRFDVNDRNRRPPRDPVNAVLSFAYALLTKELTVTLQAVGFDPMLGLFHQPRYGRPSLALDMTEEYRPLIADSVMLTAFNNGELSSDRFLERAGAVTLTPAGRAAVIAAFERRMTTEVTHPIFGYRVSYRRLLEVQCRLLARTLLGEIESYPAFCTR